MTVKKSMAAIRAQQSLAPAALEHAQQAENVADSIHAPVLLNECVDLLTPHMGPGKVIVDCTLGLAGHAEAFLRANPDFHLVGIDRDEEALRLAARRLEPFAGRFTLVHNSFMHFEEVLDELGIDKVDAAFLDLGLSSLQIDERDRGFTYSADAPLDMRMDVEQKLTAADIVATYSVDQLAQIFTTYGQEKFAYRIARAIVEQRESAPIERTSQLVELVDHVVPRRNRPAGNPAKRVFQALRIEVNGELEQLASTLPQIARRLNIGGAIVVESYHSLEDRITKSFFRMGQIIDAPAGLPIVPEEYQPYFTDLTHGAQLADEREITTNPRSASVRLRATELIREIPEHAHADFEQWLEGKGLGLKPTAPRKSSVRNSSARKSASRAPGGQHSSTTGRRRENTSAQATSKQRRGR